jgi:hypothetical protein
MQKTRAWDFYEINRIIFALEKVGKEITERLRS